MTKLLVKDKDAPRPWKPHPYQKRAVEFLLARVGAGIFLTPGFGKTSIALKAIQILKEAGEMRSVLLVAPLRVCHQVWPRELRKWLDFHGLSATILHGDVKEKRAHEKHDIYIINPEGLPWFFNSGAYRRIRPDVLLIDELSKFKHSKTQRFKLLRPYLGAFKRRWGLTGSPAANGLLDLFGQMYVLDVGRSLGPYITHYRMRFFTPTGYGGYTWALKRGAERQIYDAIAPTVMSLSEDEHLKMPEQLDNPIYIELPPSVRKFYDEMEDELIAWVQNQPKAVTAASSAAAMMKCSQIANGGVFKTPEPGVKFRTNSERWINLHDEKTDAVLELLEELQGAPLLITYDFEHDWARLQAALTPLWKAHCKNHGLPEGLKPLEVPYIGGGITPKYGKAVEDAWNNGWLPFFLAQPASAHAGLNIQESGFDICWHSLTHNYEHYDQLIRRLRRQGQRSKFIRNHLIIAKNTVDEAKRHTVGGKARTQNALFDALKEYGSGKNR